MLRSTLQLPHPCKVHGTGRNASGSLPGQVRRCVNVRRLHAFFDQPMVHLRSVSGQDDALSLLPGQHIQLFTQRNNIDGSLIHDNTKRILSGLLIQVVLRLGGIQDVPGPAEPERINAGKHLIPARIHHRHDQTVRTIIAVSHRFQRRNMDDRFVQCKADPFGCSGSDPKARKRSRPSRDGDCIQTVQIQIQRPPDLLQHRHQCLAVRPPEIHRILRQEYPVFHDSHTGRHPRTVNRK